MNKQETIEEVADAIETKYTSGKRNNFKYDIDWVIYILWTIICVCFGMVLGMFTAKLIYGL
jgi:energy-coupling factor transporter transmembrane protein EcfT